MTEEIIIDGVNVAGCEYHRMKNKMAMCTACNSGVGSPFCEYEKDCYYKQLQKLKEENERLKNERTADLVKQLKDLRSENEALIKENEDMKKSFVSHSEFMDILENNPNINWEETAKENIYLINKYCKALEEIREIMQENCNQCFEIDNFTKPDDCGICEWARVLKVINEVLEDDK